MKIALVHELLTMRGGAERVLRVVADMFPEAPIYTLLYDERKLGQWFPRERIRFSTLQKYSFLSKDHHLYLPFFPGAVEQWDFSEFDLVISFSSAFAHGIIVKPPTKHLSYIHTPARYLWDQTFDVLDRICPVGARHAVPLQRLKRWYLERIFHTLRQWDSKASERGDMLLAASKAVQRRIELYFRRESEVLYPPVDIDMFEINTGEREDYYVIASTLVPYKRIELAIEACNQLGRKLKIVGEGPHRKELERRARDTVEFFGYMPHEDLAALLRNARGFIFPGEEDFGIAPLEAMASGTPVIAFGKGGALETVVEGKTGIFFKEPTPESLMKTLEHFEQEKFDPMECGKQAEKFSQSRFEDGLRESIAELISE